MMTTDNEKKIVALVSQAEEIKDPLHDIVDRVKDDPGVVFAQECIDALAELKAKDRQAFERLRHELKAAGVRVAELEKFIMTVTGGAVNILAADPSTATRIVELMDDADLFHDADGNCYADVEVDGHRETWDLRSKSFQSLVRHRFFDAVGAAPPGDALRTAIHQLEAEAQFKGPERQVFLRVGGDGNNVFIDLGDPKWRAVEITAGGWQIVSRPSVRFRRPSGHRPLVVPEQGGSIELLRRHLNIVDEGEFALVVAWLLAALRYRGPFPVLVLTGEQGAAKSTFAKLTRMMVDPNTVPLRSMPRNIGDLFIAARNGHVLAFDNLSGISWAMSDALCRLATGGGFSARQLYTDVDETLLNEVRPIILNGIEDFVQRADLADRCLMLGLKPIAKADRRPEAEVLRAFESDLPRIFGALLDMIAHGMDHLPDVTLPELPRMADFAIWATACETARWPAGTFMAAYEANRSTAIENVIEADVVATAIRELMLGVTEWTGSATLLLQVLSRSADDYQQKDRWWPKTPSHLSGRLRRAVPSLRSVGIEVHTERVGRNRERLIHIERTADFDAKHQEEEVLDEWDQRYDDDDCDAPE